MMQERNNQVLDHFESENKTTFTKRARNYFLAGIMSYALIACVGYFLSGFVETTFITVTVLVLSLAGYIALIISLINAVKAVKSNEKIGLMFIAISIGAILLFTVLSLVMFANALDLVRFFRG